MSTLIWLQFSVDIDAPVAQVHRLMLDDQGYRYWTASFADGSYYEGSWETGGQLRFLTPPGDGMLAEVVEHRPGEFVSLRHLGHLRQGALDSDSEWARDWQPALENYRFSARGRGTRVEIEQQANAAFADYLRAAWPPALQRLKALCEGRHNAQPADVSAINPD